MSSGAAWVQGVMGVWEARGAAGALGSLTDVSVAWPGIEEVARTLSLRAGYNAAVVVLGTTLLGIAAGVIGSFALLRKRALMGDALAHATLPGIALAFLAATWLGGEGRSLPVLLAGATVTGVLGVVCVQLITRHTRLHEDTAIGAVLSVFFGVGVVLLSYLQSMDRGNVGGLNHFIYGQTAAMSRGDAALIGGVAAGAVIAAVLLLKEFRAVCFDDRFAAALGLPVWFIDGLMMSLVVVVTVIGLQAVGLILVVAMLIIPPATARFWTDRLGRMVVLSGVIGGASGYLGSVASALLPRLPAGSVIVLTAGALFLVSMLFAPARGVVAAAVRGIVLRVHVARDHVLRGVYEALEESGGLGVGKGGTTGGVAVAELGSVRSVAGPMWALVTWWARRAGFIRWEQGGRMALTGAGLAEAARLVRNHRLWEEYLVTHADVAANHVDRSADLVEHVLSPELVGRLEGMLRERGELPGVPRSVHPIGTAHAGSAVRASPGEAAP